jgi:phosphate transport system permease protein
MMTRDKAIETLLSACALASILIIVLIFVFIVANGLPILMEKGTISFIFGPSWKPDFEIYGIFPLIVGSLAITVLALVLALPLGLGCAILIAEVAPLWVRDVLRPAIDTLAGIPSILYGLFGLVIIVPFIMSHLGGPGQSVLACGLVLAVMVLPTIISISEDSMRAVPRELREGSLAMGATQWQMIRGIVVPSAMSGIVTGAVLAMGRAVGETMAVVMDCGGVGLIPSSLLDPVYPLTAVIASEWGYSSGLHQTALFAIGIVLLVIVMIFNSVILFARRYGISGSKV